MPDPALRQSTRRADVVAMVMRAPERLRLLGASLVSWQSSGRRCVSIEMIGSGPKGEDP